MRIGVVFIFLLQIACQSPTIAQDIDPLKSPEGLTDLFLELISGPIGEERDWDQFRTLFAPGAIFYSTRPDAPEGKQVVAHTVEDFIERIGPAYARSGFLEISLGTRVHEFNGMANVFQSFHAKNLTGTYDEKGINAYQLTYLNDRWYILSLNFVNAEKGQDLPKEFVD